MYPATTALSGDAAKFGQTMPKCHSASLINPHQKWHRLSKPSLTCERIEVLDLLCKPRQVGQTVSGLFKTWPDLILRYLTRSRCLFAPGDFENRNSAAYDVPNGGQVVKVDVKMTRFDLASATFEAPKIFCGGLGFYWCSNRCMN